MRNYLIYYFFLWFFLIWDVLLFICVFWWGWVFDWHSLRNILYAILNIFLLGLNKYFVIVDMLVFAFNSYIIFFILMISKTFVFGHFSYKNAYVTDQVRSIVVIQDGDVTKRKKTKDLDIINIKNKKYI